MSLGDSKMEKIQFEFQALSTVASSLNSASNELTKAVATLDEALQKLNLGLTVWVNFASHGKVIGEYDYQQVGYCKLAGKWGIALLHKYGKQQVTHRQDGPWAFTDAPRDMRLACVEAIPKLIEALRDAASATTQKVQAKTQEVRAFASVIERIANAKKTGLPSPPPPLVKPSALDPTPDSKRTIPLADLMGGKKGGK